jgi:hypothetical protein
MSYTGFNTTVNTQDLTQNTLDLLNPKVLIIGEKLSSGTATSGALVENITSKIDANTQFGGSSPIYQAIDLALSLINPNGISRFQGSYKTKISAIGYNITGTAGVYKIAPTGTAVAGKIKLRAGSEYKNTIEITTTAGEALSSVSGKIIAGLNVIANFPATASLSTDDTLITASMAGVWFNDFKIEVIENTSGLTLTISQTVVGVGAADVSTLLATIETNKFDLIVWGLKESTITSDIKTAIETRISTLNNRDLSGIMIIPAIDTKANLLTLIDGYKSKEGFAIICQKATYQTELPIECATRYAIQRSLKNTQDCKISDYVPNSEATNGLGSPSYNASAMSDNILLNHSILRNNFSVTELLELKDAGAIVIENNDSKTAAIYGCDLTTYSLTTLGETAIMRDVGNWNTINFVSGYIFANAKADFVGKTITNGNAVAGSQQIDAYAIKQALVKYYDTLTSKDDDNIIFALISNNAEDKNNFINEIDRSLQLNLTNGQFSVNDLSRIVSPLKKGIINAVYRK